jgi:predicted TIM-barrel fold metal-dependent hydrolase
MASSKWISSDSHMNEVPATWERVQKKHGDLAPKIVQTEEGTFLVVEGWTNYPVPLPSRKLIGAGAPIGEQAYIEEVTHEYVGLATGKFGKDAKEKRQQWRAATGTWTGAASNDAEAFRKNFRFEDLPGPGLDPAARIKDQDADGVQAEVLYPSFMCRLYQISASNLSFFHDIADSYNEWQIDFASHDPRRLIAQPVLSVLDPEQAAKDLVGYANRGIKACAIASSVPFGSSYGEEKFDPIWRAAQECNIPLAMHQNTGGFKDLFSDRAALERYGPTILPHTVRSFIGPQTEIEISLAEIIYGGVFDRFPNLKLVCGEFDIGWIGHVFQRKSRFDARLGLELAPADYFKRNVWFTFQDDRAGCLHFSIFGEDNFMWASDYPHPATTWPNSAADLDRQFDGVSDEIRRKVTFQNVIDLYGLDFEA